MVALETWIALGSLVMAIMFIALMFSFYVFLIGPDGKGPQVSTDPGALLIQVISISGAPSLILAGTVLGVAKRPEGKPPGVILIMTGILLAAGMAFLATIVPQIDYRYRVFGIDFVPFIFIFSGIGIIACGIFVLNNTKKVKTKLDGEIK